MDKQEKKGIAIGAAIGAVVGVIGAYCLRQKAAKRLEQQ